MIIAGAAAEVEASGSEDKALRFCYDADLGRGGGTFEVLQKRIRWNLEAATEPPPVGFSDSALATEFGPFGDHGYIYPFTDFQDFVVAPRRAQPATLAVGPRLKGQQRQHQLPASRRVSSWPGGPSLNRAPLPWSSNLAELNQSQQNKAKERHFPATVPPGRKPWVFTRYFVSSDSPAVSQYQSAFTRVFPCANAPPLQRLQLSPVASEVPRSGGGGRVPSPEPAPAEQGSSTPSEPAGDTEWLSSVVDHALLELEDLVVCGGGLLENDRPCGEDRGRPDVWPPLRDHLLEYEVEDEWKVVPLAGHRPLPEFQTLELMEDLLCTIAPQDHWDDGLDERSGQSRDNAQITSAVDLVGSSGSRCVGMVTGAAERRQAGGGPVSSELPWPWIDIPISGGGQEAPVGWGVSGWLRRSDTLNDDPPQYRFDYPNGRSGSGQGQQGGSGHYYVLFPASPPLLSRSLWKSCEDDELASGMELPEKDRAGEAEEDLEAGSPIPVICPLGMHRAQGGKRVLPGRGVEHMNLIQIVGNPAHKLQPTLSSSSRVSCDLSDSSYLQHQHLHHHHQHLLIPENRSDWRPVWEVSCVGGLKLAKFFVHDKH